MLKGLIIRKAFVAADVFLAALVALTAVLAVMKTLEPPPKPPSYVADATSSGDYEAMFASLAPRTEYDVIVKSGIFGPAAQKNVNTKPPEPPPIEEEETPTTLPLRLLGEVFAGERDPLATALLEVREGGQRIDTFYIGQEIVDRVFLREVRSKEILLDNQRTGKNEVLKRDDNPYRYQVAAQPVSPAVQAATERATASNVIQLDKLELQQDLLDNYEHIATTVDVREYVDENGEVKGLTAPNISSVELASKLGLQDNDVLTSINNEPIDSVDKVYDIINKYRNASTFRLGILRDGRPQYLTYRLR